MKNLLTSSGATPRLERAVLKKEGDGFPITMASTPVAN